MGSKCNRGPRFRTQFRWNAVESIPISFKIGSQPSDNGVMKLYKTESKKGQLGWRAYVQYYNEPSNTRVFGTWRPSRLATVNNLLAKLDANLTAAERTRVRRITVMPAIKPRRGKKGQAAEFVQARSQVCREKS